MLVIRRIFEYARIAYSNIVLQSQWVVQIILLNRLYIRYNLVLFHIIVKLFKLYYLESLVFESVNYVRFTLYNYTLKLEKLTTEIILTHNNVV